MDALETNTRTSLNTQANDSSAQIKNSIEKTRSEMGDAAEELGRRLDPKRIAKNFVDNSSTLQFVKRHPMSLSLLALGTAMYVIEKRRPTLTHISPEAAKRSVRDGVEMAKEKVQEGVEKVKSTVSDARETLVQAGDKAKELAVQGMERSQQIYEANPIAIGLAAFAAGVALSWLIPVTEREQRMLGTPSRQILDKAKHLVTDAKQYAQSVM